VFVGGGGVTAPGAVVGGFAVGARHDDVAHGADPVLGLVGEECAVVDVTGGMQPPAGRRLVVYVTTRRVSATVRHEPGVSR
jgi:hypothetical protein